MKVAAEIVDVTAFQHQGSEAIGAIEPGDWIITVDWATDLNGTVAGPECACVDFLDSEAEMGMLRGCGVHDFHDDGKLHGSNVYGFEGWDVDEMFRHLDWLKSGKVGLELDFDMSVYDETGEAAGFLFVPVS